MRKGYERVILGNAILLAVMGFGIAGSLSGNFIAPVTAEFDSSVSAFTLFTSVEAASMAVLYPLAGKILTKYRIGKVMGTALFVEVIAIVLMAFAGNVSLFYLAGFLLGISAAFSRFTAIPILLHMWYKKDAGKALGITMACGAAGGLLFNYFSAYLITACGWRNAYLVLAFIGFLLSVPVFYFLVKTPQEKGVLPYGYSEAKKMEKESVDGFTREQAFRVPSFYLVWAACLCISVGSCIPGYIASYATKELGYSVSGGAVVSMCVSLGAMACGYILGYLNDRFGVQAGLGWGVMFSVIGCGVLPLAGAYPAALIPGALLLGLGGSLYAVQASLLAKRVLGEKDFPGIWSLMMVGNSLIGAFSFSPMGMFYDVFGSFLGAFITCGAFFLLSLFFGLAAVKTVGKR